MTVTDRHGDRVIPYLQDADLTLWNGDALEVLRTLPDESVHMCVTSPPFYGLRDYGTGRWEGGDPDCDHLGEPFRTKAKLNENWGAGFSDGKNAEDRQPFKKSCGKCGAIRIDQQIGLEASPDEWVAKLVAVFREVRRVLRSDGVCFIEVGDSYVSGQGGRQSSVGELPPVTRFDRKEAGVKREGLPSSFGERDVGPRFYPTRDSGLKPKDLVGGPWMLAFALRADGWYLRSDIVWARPNPMPESVTDRPTKSHSYVFLLSKSPRYYFDAEAVREKFNEPQGGRAVRRYPEGFKEDASGSGRSGRLQGPTLGQIAPPQVETLDGLWECLGCGVVKTKTNESAAEGCGACGGSLVLISGEAPRGPDGRRVTHVQGQDGSLQHRDGERWPNSGRNVRSVWSIATEAYPDAHFATYPQELVRRCILAGTSERGCCPECGAPWKREVEQRPGERTGGSAGVGRHDADAPPNGRYDGWVPRKVETTTLGWRPSCDHHTHPFEQDSYCEPIPCTVLDPFAGSGTTGLVARKHGRRSVLIELSEAYVELAAKRVSQLSLFSEIGRGDADSPSVPLASGKTDTRSEDSQAHEIASTDAA